jgi:hypothetical protein
VSVNIPLSKSTFARPSSQRLETSQNRQGPHQRRSGSLAVEHGALGLVFHRAITAAYDQSGSPAGPAPRPCPVTRPGQRGRVLVAHHWQGRAEPLTRSILRFEQAPGAASGSDPAFRRSSGRTRWCTRRTRGLSRQPYDGQVAN